MNLYKRLKKQTYIIAEMSANHVGKISNAKDIIYAAKEAGADCIKVQTYTADTLTLDCDNPYFRIADGPWRGETLYSLYQKAYTPWEWQEELKEEAQKIGIDFLSTPFDDSAVDFLEKLGIEFYKIASFELVDIPLIRYVASKKKPVILSVGMATLGEIQDAVRVLREAGIEFALLKCSSAYPAIPENMNLRTIANMKETFGVPVGLSDHSLGSVSAVTAVALGACIIEKHICLDKNADNPDVSFSMEAGAFRQMVKDIREAEKAIGNINYEMTENERENICFRRSIFATKDIGRGEKLTKDNIRIIRPGQGLAPKYYDEVLGQYALTDLEKGTPLRFELIGEI